MSPPTIPDHSRYPALDPMHYDVKEKEASTHDRYEPPLCDNEKVDVLLIVDLSASMSPIISIVFQTIKTFSIQHNENNMLWAIIAGPKNIGTTPGNKNYLQRVSDLTRIDKFLSKIEDINISQDDMIGQYEMLYDALYLSLRNLSLYLPYENDQLLWPTWIGDVLEESDPPIEDFYINWRDDSKKIIIVFTDEPGQSFLIPKSELGKSYNTMDTITQQKLTKMIATIENIEAYAFTPQGACKDGVSGWKPIVDETKGGWHQLTPGVETISSYLESIMLKDSCY